MKRVLVIWLLLGIAPLSPGKDVLDGLRDEGRGFAQVTPGRPLQFPQDHGAHPDYRIEWWYLTANLLDEDGRHWGIQWTLFRQSLSPQSVTTGWQSNQVWMAHAAITTPDGHVHEQRFARGGIGQAGITDIDSDGLFNAWLDDWEWRSESASMFPATLTFDIGDQEVSLLLETELGPVANGIEGYSQKSSQGQASYYYSQPYIRISGDITTVDGKTRLDGQGWLDREWSSQALAANQQGWDWFSLHLDSGNKLMIYQLRHDDGKHWLSGNLISPSGASQFLDASMIALRPSRITDIEVGNKERRALPMDWQISVEVEDMVLHTRPLYDQQWMQTTIPYWEGVVLVEDDKGNSAGIGYMELTGY